MQDSHPQPQPNYTTRIHGVWFREWFNSISAEARAADGACGAVHVTPGTAWHAPSQTPTN